MRRIFALGLVLTLIFNPGLGQAASMLDNSNGEDLRASVAVESALSSDLVNHIQSMPAPADQPENFSDNPLQLIAAAPANFTISATGPDLDISIVVTGASANVDVRGENFSRAFYNVTTKTITIGDTSSISGEHFFQLAEANGAMTLLTYRNTAGTIAESRYDFEEDRFVNGRVAEQDLKYHFKDLELNLAYGSYSKYGSAGELTGEVFYNTSPDSQGAPVHSMFYGNVIKNGEPQEVQNFIFVSKNALFKPDLVIQSFSDSAYIIQNATAMEIDYYHVDSEQPFLSVTFVKEKGSWIAKKTDDIPEDLFSGFSQIIVGDSDAFGSETDDIRIKTFQKSADGSEWCFFYGALDNISRTGLVIGKSTGEFAEFYPDRELVFVNYPKDKYVQINGVMKEIRLNEAGFFALVDAPSASKQLYVPAVFDAPLVNPFFAGESIQVSSFSLLDVSEPLDRFLAAYTKTVGKYVSARTTRSGNQIALTFPTIAGHIYQIQSFQNPATSSNVSQIIGTGLPYTFTGDLSDTVKGFRVYDLVETPTKQSLDQVLLGLNIVLADGISQAEIQSLASLDNAILYSGTDQLGNRFERNPTTYLLALTRAIALDKAFTPTARFNFSTLFGISNANQVMASQSYRALLLDIVSNIKYQQAEFIQTLSAARTLYAALKVVSQTSNDKVDFETIFGVTIPASFVIPVNATQQQKEALVAARKALLELTGEAGYDAAEFDRALPLAAGLLRVLRSDSVLAGKFKLIYGFDIPVVGSIPSTDFRKQLFSITSDLDTDQSGPDTAYTQGEFRRVLPLAADLLTALRANETKANQFASSPLGGLMIPLDGTLNLNFRQGQIGYQFSAATKLEKKSFFDDQGNLLYSLTFSENGSPQELIANKNLVNIPAGLTFSSLNVSDGATVNLVETLSESDARFFSSSLTPLTPLRAKLFEITADSLYNQESFFQSLVPAQGVAQAGSPAPTLLQNRTSFQNFSLQSIAPVTATEQLQKKRPPLSFSTVKKYRKAV